MVHVCSNHNKITDCRLLQNYFSFNDEFIVLLFLFLRIGFTPLHRAAEFGSTGVLNALLNVTGCDMNMKVMYANLVLVSLLGVNKVF